MLGEGPETRWHHELHSVPREGLILLIDSLNSTISYLTMGPFDHDQMLANVRQARKYGRALNASKRIDAYLANPQGEAEKWIGRVRAAKKAARRRKREGR